ncbi:MAG: (Fe-S)-binding protein [Thermodesulfobacteriota bacterium]
MKPIIVALLTIFAFGFFFYNIYTLIKVLRIGKHEMRYDNIPERIKKVLIYVFGQKRLVKNYTFAGIAHFMIFWGFVIITIGTIEMLAGGVFPGFRLILGEAHKVYEFILDIVQLLVLVAIGMGIINRTIIGKRREVNGLDAIVVLGLIFGLMITAFGVTGSAIAMGNGEPAWQPVSSVFATLFFNGMSENGLIFTNEFFWWFHIFIVLGFLNYLPYSKHSHVFTAVPNVFFQNLKPRGALNPIDFENVPDDIDHFGAGKLEDFTWKDILDAYTCTECGRCTDNCPAWHTEKPLSPREIVVKLRHYASSEGTAYLNGDAANGAELQDIPGPEWVTEDELWACTSCNACVEQCPLFIDQMGKIMEMRRFLTLEGRITGPAAKTLQKLQTHGNPWGFSESDRAKWVAGVEDLNVLGEDGVEDATEFDFVYWMGCYGGYDPRGQNIAQSVVSLLQQAGVKFAVLGPKEKCTGDPARRLGEEALYQMLATENIENMNNFKVKKVIANCPHCFNTIKNEYPQFGGDFEVINHTQLLSDLVEQGKLKPTKEVNEDVVYHDPCYLGRYNRVFDAPRKVLKSIPGLNLIELDRNREKSFCCGAGGGKIWMEEEAPRVNWNRFEEVEAKKPDTVAVACYFCDTMFEDAAKQAGNEDIEIKDISVILRESVELDSKPKE